MYVESRESAAVEALIAEIATNVARSIQHPPLLAVPVLAGIALLSGAAARMVELVESHRIDRRRPSR